MVNVMPNGESKPVPDPSTLTTSNLQREIGMLRELLDDRQDSRQREQAALQELLESKLAVVRERLDGIDKATEVLNEAVNRTPTDIQKEILHLRELMQVELQGITVQFKERDTRSEREARDNTKAVDAAFAAQKESASEQNKSNTLAIDKSAQGTKESIDKLAELFKSTTDSLGDKIADSTITDALGDKIDDIRYRVGKMESVKQGGKEALYGIYALAGFLVMMLVIGGSLAAAGVFTK